LFPVHKPGDWEWVWRENLGVPAFRQSRPSGYVGLPSVESQAAYLDRLGLLSDEERAALPASAFDTEDVDPFLITEDEVRRLGGGYRVHHPETRTMMPGKPPRAEQRA